MASYGFCLAYVCFLFEIMYTLALSLELLRSHFFVFSFRPFISLVCVGPLAYLFYVCGNVVVVQFSTGASENHWCNLPASQLFLRTAQGVCVACPYFYYLVCCMRSVYYRTKPRTMNFTLICICSKFFFYVSREICCSFHLYCISYSSQILVKVHTC